MTGKRFPVVGILGSGQLGRMLAQVARRLDQETAVFSPQADTPTGQVANREVVGAYEDLDAIRAFAKTVDVITYEFENVPLATAMAAAEIVPVHPDPALLAVAQNRIREKNFFTNLGLPVAPYHVVNRFEELTTGLEKIGVPAVLKTAESGYDGKGQVKLNDPAEAEGAWHTIKERPAVLEGWLTFEQEISVVGARDKDGQFAHYGPIENRHVNHILDLSIFPAEVAPKTAEAAISGVERVMRELNVIGVVCIEFFVTAAGDLIVNEIAPRPHNSGHLTIEGHVTSQFEQQLRTVSGYPLGSVAPTAPATAMANLLGDLWPSKKVPDWGCLLQAPAVKLHLYGKRAARPGRKMGHFTVAANSRSHAIETAMRMREKLRENLT